MRVYGFWYRLYSADECLLARPQIHGLKVVNAPGLRTQVDLSVPCIPS